MRTRMLFILIGFSTVLNSEAQNLRAEFAMTRFNSPTDGPYVETYLKLKGNSLGIIETKEGVRSEVILTYKIQTEQNTVFEDAFKMNGPLIVADSLKQDFIAVQRIPLEKGNYKLLITLRDVSASDSSTVKLKQDLTIEKTIDFEATLLSTQLVTNPVTGLTSETSATSGATESINYFISDIQLVDSYTKTTSANQLSKNGFDLIPFTSNYYPEGISTLSFYAEIYNTEAKAIQKKRAVGRLFKDKSQFHKYLINIFIESADNGKITSDLRTYIKHDSATVIPVLHSFPLDKVPTGNYNLVIELRDSENDLLERKLMFFQRANSAVPDYVRSADETMIDEIDMTFVGKYNRKEALEEYLRCLHPISTQEEIHQVNRKMNFNDLAMMKKFMYNFWKQRNPDNPEDAWLKYWKEVEKVNANYSNNLRKGYDTDRGRVYLQYGAPNTISPNYFEPNTYPYEIWHYYTLRDHLSADQSNRKFIFANTTQGDKEFLLIHSDAKNEITNIRWNYDLYKRSNATIDLDQENGNSQYGGRSKEFFENPY